MNMGTREVSTVQQLLRGRLLYVALGVLLVWLYARGASLHPVDAFPRPSGAAHAQSASLDWWPSQLDVATVQRAVREQPGLASVLSALTALALVLAGSGVGVLVWALWTGRLRSVWRFPAHRLPGWSFGELGRIALLTLGLAAALPFARVGVQVLLQVAHDPHVTITVSMLVLDSGVILTVLSFASGKGQPLRQTFGCSARLFGGSLATTLRGYAAVFPWLFFLLFAMGTVLRRMGWTPPPEPLQELIFEEHRVGVLALTVVLACVVGPVAEELFFRGVLYPALRRRASRLAAMVGSAAAFSLVHANVLGFLPILLLGCLLADLYERTGSLLSPLAVHIAHNSLLMSVALVMRQLLGVVG